MFEKGLEAVCNNRQFADCDILDETIVLFAKSFLYAAVNCSTVGLSLNPCFEKCLVNVQRTTIFHGDNIIEERSPTGDPAEVICEFEFQLNLSNCNEYTLMISSAFRC